MIGLALMVLEHTDQTPVLGLHGLCRDLGKQALHAFAAELLTAGAVLVGEAIGDQVEHAARG